MSEQDLITGLGSIVGTPINPRESFSEDLWHLIESELIPDVSPTVISESAVDETDFDVSFRPTPSQQSRWNPVWAAAAAFTLVLGAGVLVWWLLATGQTDVADTDPAPEFTVPGPVQLASGDVLWPAYDMTGTPSSVAEAFAVDVFGWNQAVATETERRTCLTFPSRNTEDCPLHATTVRVSQPGVDPLQVILTRIGGTETEQLWAVAQAGPGYTTDRLEATETGTRIRLPTVENAVEADITMRVAEDFNLIEVSAGTTDLDTGYVDTNQIPDPENVLSVLVRYRNTEGHVITAAGGPWNEFYEWPPPEPAGPEVMIAEGTYQGSTDSWRMSAFETTDGNLCIRLEGMGCVADISADRHLGAFLTSSGFQAGQEARWCVYGTVRNADALQIHLSDGSWTSIPIYTTPNFNVDFYAYCALGNQPASAVQALDTNGNLIDQVPDTENR